MATNIFLGYPPPYIEQWYKNPHPEPVLTGATWFDYADGTSQSALVTTLGDIPEPRNQLTSISFGAACEGVSPYAFEGCTALTALYVPYYGITCVNIYEHALERSNIHSLSIGGSGQYISDGAMKCDTLEDLYALELTMADVSARVDGWKVGVDEQDGYYHVVVHCSDGTFDVNGEGSSSGSEEPIPDESSSGSGVNIDSRHTYIKFYDSSTYAGAYGHGWIDLGDCADMSAVAAAIDSLTGNQSSMSKQRVEKMIIGTTEHNLDFQWTGSDLVTYGFTGVRMMMIQGRSLWNVSTLSTFWIFDVTGLTELYFPSMATGELQMVHADLGIGRDGSGNSQ